MLTDMQLENQITWCYDTSQTFEIENNSHMQNSRWYYPSFLIRGLIAMNEVCTFTSKISMEIYDHYHKLTSAIAKRELIASWIILSSYLYKLEFGAESNNTIAILCCFWIPSSTQKENSNRWLPSYTVDSL